MAAARVPSFSRVACPHLRGDRVASDKSGRKKPKGKPRNSELLFDTMSDVELFAKWKRDVLPKLFQATKEGKTAEELYRLFADDAAARLIQIAITSPDQGKALAAAQDILDRTAGKATQKTQVEHKYEKLKDEELDALLRSKLAESAVADEH